MLPSADAAQRSPQSYGSPPLARGFRSTGNERAGETHPDLDRSSAATSPRHILLFLPSSHDRTHRYRNPARCVSHDRPRADQDAGGHTHAIAYETVDADGHRGWPVDGGWAGYRATVDLS